MRLAFAGNLLSRAHVHSLKGANGVFISLLKICHIMLDTMLVGRGSSSCVILETQQQFSLCNQAALLQLCRGSFRLWDLLPSFLVEARHDKPTTEFHIIYLKCSGMFSPLKHRSNAVASRGRDGGNSGGRRRTSDQSYHGVQRDHSGGGSGFGLDGNDGAQWQCWWVET